MYNYNLNNDYVANKEMNFKTLQDARHDLIGELEAIIQYDEHIHNSNIKDVNKTWEFIRDGELMHIGELLGIMFYLAPYQKPLVDQGFERFIKRINEK